MTAYLPSIIPLIGAVFFAVAGAQCVRGGKRESGRQLLVTSALLAMAAAGLFLL